MSNQELIESLIKTRDEHLKIAESINATIEALSGNKSNESAKGNNNGYEPTWQLSDKVAFFFKRESRFMHNRELADLAHKEEPDVPSDEFVGKFSSVLSRLKKEEQLTTIQIGKSLRNTFWGSPKWLDENGEIKKGYEINEEYIIDKQKKKLDLF